MAYNNWKMMDKLDVAVRTGDDSYRGFSGYVVEHGDKEALEKAKNWARTQTWDQNLRKHVATHEPEVHTFENEGFTAKIMESAGGSSQGGRLSFWMCEVEKDGVKFRIGVNDAVLADLIRNSTIKNGVVQEKVMFARRAGQPGLIHEGMDSYQEAMADTKHKADMKAMKKTNKWGIGGVYSSITMTDICIGEVYDTLEHYVEEEPYGTWYSRKKDKFRKRETPVKTLAWIQIGRYRHEEMPKDFTELLKKELASGYVHFNVGKPPSRAKTGQLEIKKSDMKLLEKLLAERQEYANYGEERVKGRYVRTI